VQSGVGFSKVQAKVQCLNGQSGSYLEESEDTYIIMTGPRHDGPQLADLATGSKFRMCRWRSKCQFYLPRRSEFDRINPKVSMRSACLTD
jgi:hypothetical protein